MFGSRKGQVSGGVLLVAAALAGVYFAGVGIEKGAKKVAHFVAKPFHHDKKK
jgi:hypothetical protein